VGESVTWLSQKQSVRLSPVVLSSFLLTCVGKKLLSEKDRLYKEAREAARVAREAARVAGEAFSKEERLRKQLEFLEDREQKMIARELASIEELEALEAEDARVAQSSVPQQESSFDDLLPSGPDFDQIDWAGFADDNVLPTSSNS